MYHRYALTCFTTIGYGTFVPATEGGKWATVWYSFFGFVIFGIASAPLVELLVKAERTIAERTERLVSTAGRVKVVAVDSDEGIGKEGSGVEGSGEECSGEAPTEVPGLLKGSLQLGVSFGITCLWLVIMGACFQGREGWELGDAFYWAFITSTSIGFGDMSPDSSLNWAPTFILIPLGLVVMAAFFEVVSGVFMPDTAPVFALAKGLARKLSFREEKDQDESSWIDKLLLIIVSWGVIFLILVIGGAILGGLERDAERQAAQQWWVDFNHTFTASAAEVLPNDVMGNSTAIAAATARLMDQLGRMGTCDFPDENDSNWDLSPATVYLFTALSTVGYGSFSVSTDAGRRFVVLYSGLFLWVFAATLQLLADCLTPMLEAIAARLGPVLIKRAEDIALVAIKGGSKDLDKNGDGKVDRSEIKQRTFTAREQQFYVLVYFGATFGFMVAFLSLGAVLFLALDPALDMEFSNGFWFLFVTASTVGFGDTVPDFTKMYSFVTFLELVYVTAGFVVVAVAVDTCTNLGSEKGRKEIWLLLSKWVQTNENGGDKLADGTTDDGDDDDDELADETTVGDKLDDATTTSSGAASVSAAEGSLPHVGSIAGPTIDLVGGYQT
jgi:hypothetical protein